MIVAVVAAAASVFVLGLEPGVGVAYRLARLHGTRRAGLGGVVATGPLILALLLGAGFTIGTVALIVPGTLLGGAGVRRRRHRRTAVAGRLACIDLVHALAAELRAGRTPATALAAVAAAGGVLAGPLGRAAAAAASGADPADELALMADRPGCRSIVALAATWRVADRYGGRVADALDRLGAGLEADERARRELDAALAAPRTTMLVLALLPLFGVALGASIGADPLHLLLHERLGWGLLTAAAVLDAVGLFWVSRLVGGARPT